MLSRPLTAPLAALIVAQISEQAVDQTEITAIKKNIRKTNRQRQEDQAKEIHNHLNPKLRHSIDLAREKGCSGWLSVLQLEDHDFYVQKGEFRDALCLKYGWSLRNTPHTCNCGTVFSVDHAMIWHMGGYPTIRHNEKRAIKASLLTEVFHNVATEPLMQPLTGETLTLRSANSEDGTRLDIRAWGFWNR